MLCRSGNIWQRGSDLLQAAMLCSRIRAGADDQLYLYLATRSAFNELADADLAGPPAAILEWDRVVCHVHAAPHVAQACCGRARTAGLQPAAPARRAAGAARSVRRGVLCLVLVLSGVVRVRSVGNKQASARVPCQIPSTCVHCSPAAVMTSPECTCARTQARRACLPWMPSAA
jgi:hypothetical protein